MKKCIYCREAKEDVEFSLEHIIPKFLGGEYAPDEFKTKNVCKRCNNNLGFFVDGEFSKNFFVYNQLKKIGNDSFLRCLGILDLSPPNISAKEVCELYIGPLGELVFWIRPQDERLSSYSGGNPRSAKDLETRAYFCFSEKSNTNQMLSWRVFNEAFRNRKKVKKIMCSAVSGENIKNIGFSEADQLDNERINYFFSYLKNSSGRLSCKMKIGEYYANRFLAKISIGIIYALFGEKILNAEYTKQFYNTLWHKGNEPFPPIPYATNGCAKMDDALMEKIMGCQNAVTLMFFPNGNYIYLFLNISQEKQWGVACARLEDIDDADRKKLYMGHGMILSKAKKKATYLPFLDFIAYKIDEEKLWWGSRLHGKGSN